METALLQKKSHTFFPLNEALTVNFPVVTPTFTRRTDYCRASPLARQNSIQK